MPQFPLMVLRARLIQSVEVLLALLVPRALYDAGYMFGVVAMGPF